MRWIPLVALALALPACKGAPPPAAAAADPADAQAIERVVLESMQAGFARRDVDGYMAAWAPDGRVISGRTEAPGPYDVTLDHDALASSRRLRLSLPDRPSMDVRLSDVRVEVTGDTAVMHTLTHVNVQGEDTTAGEVYRMRRTRDGWRIVENRFWPRTVRRDGAEVAATDAEWARLDAAVDEARRAGDPEKRVFALMDAWRQREAADEAKRLAQAQPDDKLAQMLHAHAATSVGRTEEALAAYKRIHERWPDAPVPPAATR